MRIFREVGIAVLVAVGVFALLQWNIQSYTVRYDSMRPNIRDGDWIMVSKASYRLADLQRGDVIVFRPPFDTEYPYIKRVIGLPGDIVEVKDGKVFVNHVALEEDGILPSPSYVMPSKEIPEDEYFVLGDNRNNSNDSHKSWTVARDDIIGKAWFTYWPVDRWTVITHYRYSELDETYAPTIAVGHLSEVLLE